MLEKGIENQRARNLEDNIEMMHIEIKPNEIVCVYRGNHLMGHAIGDGDLLIDYDGREGRLRTERIYLPE